MNYGNILQVGPAVIVFAVYVFLFVLIVICLVRVSRYCQSADKERKLTRIELGKLAEEVRVIRQRLEGKKEQDSSQ